MFCIRHFKLLRLRIKVNMCKHSYQNSSAENVPNRKQFENIHQILLLFSELSKGKNSAPEKRKDTFNHWLDPAKFLPSKKRRWIMSLTPALQDLDMWNGIS